MTENTGKGALNRARERSRRRVLAGALRTLESDAAEMRRLLQLGTLSDETRRELDDAVDDLKDQAEHIARLCAQLQGERP